MSLEIQAAEPTAVAIADLKIDPDLQCRAKGTQKAIVAEYAVAMKRGDIFPPIVVFRDARGALLVAQGFHRVAACQLADIESITADVRSGSKRDALLFAVGSDLTAGLRRTTADKRRAIALVLGNFPKLSDRKIAEACGTDHKTVAATRRALAEPTGEIPQGAAEGESQPAEASEPSEAVEATVARLSKALAKLLAAWPPERRAELHTLVTAAVGGAKA